jgi:signal transduction histidine kinase
MALSGYVFVQRDTAILPLRMMRKAASPCLLGSLAVFIGALAAGNEARPATASLPGPITNAAQLRALPPAEAAKKLPVRLRAVVTGQNPGVSLFLQDETGGTFVTHIQPSLQSLQPGDDVLVEGETWPGLFVPGITSARVQRLGRRDLPPPVPVSYDELLSGRFHYERVQICGIVRVVEWLARRNCFVLKVALGTRKLDVELVVPGLTNLPPLVDARVRVVGLAAGYINPHRQLCSPLLLVSRQQDLMVELPASDPSVMPLVPVGSLLTFQPGGISGHRVRVRGTVIYHQPGQLLVLRDAEAGLLVRSRQNRATVPGDIVEVLGFPVMGHFGPYLEDAEFDVLGRESPPPPVPASVAQILQGSNNANLVQVEARLLQVLDGGGLTTLVLAHSNTAFRARLPEPLPPLRIGSLLRLTGVGWVAEANLAGLRFRALPLDVELLLRSPADIQVLEQPSGWTTQRLLLLLGVLSVVTFLAGAWVILLRRRVARQTAVILEKVQREAILEERHRMAREMHDTLAQCFAGLGFQLEALSARLPASATEVHAQLETARQMVRHAREDLRRSLMNLRAQELERGDLTQALPRLAQQLTAGTGIQLRCQLEPLPPNLSEEVQTHLLRIGHECVANAVQHARPGSIELRLCSGGGQVELRVADDGIGFDAQLLNQRTHANGHYGWRCIRERAAEIGAQVHLDTAPGHGTVITVTVPLDH